MAELTVQNIATTGLEAALAAAAGGGDSFLNNGRTFFWADNASGGDIECTFASEVSPAPAGTAAADLVVDVPAGEARLIGPFNKAAYNDASGMVNVTYESATSLTVAAVSLPE